MDDVSSIVSRSLLSFALTGCAIAPSAPSDAGEPDAATVAPPVIPWLAAGMPAIAPVSLAPCAPGWSEVSGPEATTCEPHGPTGPLDCAPGLAHFPGETDCVAVGSACPAGEWPTDLPDIGVVFVRAGAPPGGDGSRALPLPTIAAGISAVAEGGTVLIGRGRYDEAVTLRRSVNFRGVCAAETLWTTSRATAAAVLLVETASVEVRDIRIGESMAPGIWIEGAGRSVHLDGVAIDGATTVGALVGNGATLTGASVAIAHTSQAAGAFGRAVFAQAGAHVEITHAVLWDQHEFGVGAVSGSDVALTDVVIRTTRGIGASAESGSTLSLAHVFVEGSGAAGVYAIGSGTLLDLETVIVEGSLGDATGSFGRGVGVEGGAYATVRGLVARRNHDIGVVVDGADASLVGSDVAVLDTDPRLSDREYGRGLAAQRGGDIDLTRVAVVRSHEFGVFADGSTMRLVDLVLTDTRSSMGEDVTSNRGLQVQNGARVTVLRARLERNRALEMYAVRATLVAEDVVARDTLPRETDGVAGCALGVGPGGAATIRRAVFERGRHISVVVAGEAARATLEDVVIDDVRPAECGAACELGAGGIGIGAYFGGVASATRFVVSRAALCGVHLSEGGMLDLSDGEIRASGIGACVQVPGYDLGRLNSGVRYVDNGALIEGTDFPVPFTPESP